MARCNVHITFSPPVKMLDWWLIRNAGCGLSQACAIGMRTDAAGERDEGTADKTMCVRRRGRGSVGVNIMCVWFRYWVNVDEGVEC